MLMRIEMGSPPSNTLNASTSKENVVARFYLYEAHIQI